MENLHCCQWPPTVKTWFLYRPNICGSRCIYECNGILLLILLACSVIPLSPFPPSVFLCILSRLFQSSVTVTVLIQRQTRFKGEYRLGCRSGSEVPWALFTTSAHGRRPRRHHFEVLPTSSAPQLAVVVALSLSIATSTEWVGAVLFARQEGNSAATWQ